MNDFDELIAAIDDYRSVRDSWQRDVSRPGFYDPCGDAEKYAKEEIKKAQGRLSDVFRKLVRKHQSPCGCPDQPLQ